MFKIRQQGIAEVPFRPAAGALPGLEVLPLSRLAGRAAGHGLDPRSPARADFHHLLTVKEGIVRLTVDGESLPVLPSAWLWIRPEQVYRFDEGLESAQGTLIFFQPGLLDPATIAAASVDPPFPWGPLLPSEEEAEPIDRTLELLMEAYKETGALRLDAQIELIRHLLSALVLRLSHLYVREQGAGDVSEAFRAFHAAVERDYAESRTVADYARALGYSSRTLTRACIATTGVTAKRYLDERIILEARRLLFHTQLPTSAVGKRLGFPTPTAFSKFFKHHTGETPSDYRLRASGRG
ncbi:helix-turn-helix domain-containing protein [Streptomyces coffeae]|uniref:Helix-turn-helix transcriptional regulator n=1 Tax=Streptomyces coffeae TaxID=621382 RepID=A0ABS1NKB4_9ACTN|nr:AraC family transcriptional regulator [Streptomyces coffeae]MBL1100542.1 helix-turn-helix transcriptional regulator [Streptomyces coffeae]